MLKYMILVKDLVSELKFLLVQVRELIVALESAIADPSTHNLGKVLSEAKDVVHSAKTKGV